MLVFVVSFFPLCYTSSVKSFIINTVNCGNYLSVIAAVQSGLFAKVYDVSG